MIRAWGLIIYFLCTTYAVADNDTHNFILEAKQHETEFLQKYSGFAIEAKQNQALVSLPYKQETQQLLTINKNISNNNNTPSLIIFVSFSMPEQSIVSYIRGAKKIHASVVIRGLINNSFKDTFLKMSSIVKKAGDGGVELNPPLFTKFGISQVPAIVILPSEKINYSDTIYFSDTDFDVVYGDIPLFDALKIIRDHGGVSRKKAGALLSGMKDSFHE
jgi:conjugal transfer pilus assembly protein TrbC